MVFKTSKDESGNTISNIEDKLSVFKKKEKPTFGFSESFNDTFNKDLVILKKYKSAVEATMSETEASIAHLKEASSDLKKYINETPLEKMDEGAFTEKMQAEQVSIMARNKSLSNASLLIGEYNNILSKKAEIEAENNDTSQEIALTQQKYVEAIGQSNPQLAQYLKGLGSANASMKGYIGSLASATAKTIALKAATMVFNAALDIGISLLVSAALKLADVIKEAMRDPAEVINELNEEISSLQATIQSTVKDYSELKNSASEIIPEFLKLCNGVDELGKNVSLSSEEYERFWELNNKIAEMFPGVDLGLDSNGNHMLALSYTADTLRESLENLIETERQAANQEVVDNMDEAVKKVYELEKKENKQKKNAEEDRDAINERIEYIKRQIAHEGILGSIEEPGVLNLNSSENFDKWSKAYSKYINSAEGKFDWEGFINSSELSDLLSGLDKEIDNYTAKAKTRSQKLASIANSYLQTTFEYDTAGDEVQTAISKIVSGIDFDSLDIKDDDDLKNYINDKIIPVISDSTPAVQDALVNMFDIKSKLDSGKLSVDSFSEQLSNFIDILKKNGVSDDIIIGVENALGVRELAELQEKEKILLRLKELADNYNSQTNGNVDYNKRPYIKPEKMIAAGWEDFDGDIATTYSSTYSIGEGDYLYTVNVTPILEDGTVLSPESLDAYVKNLTTDDGIEGILASDEKNIVINIKKGDFDSDQDYWNSYESKLSEIKDEHFSLSQSVNLVSEGFSDNFNNALNETSDALEKAKGKLDTYQKALKETDSVAKSSVKSLSEIESLSDGLEQLGKIYNDVKDGGDFSWSSILNNEDFNKAFKDLGDDGKAYEEFVETISKSPTDINACQEAFNKLAGAYIKNTGALDDVTDATRAGTIAMLKQMGVANATEVVDSAIILNKTRAKYATEEYTSMTYVEIAALYEAAKAGSAEKQVLAELLIQKRATNDAKINTSADVEQLINLAQTANASTASLIRLSKVKSMIAKAEELEERAATRAATMPDSRSNQLLYSKAQTLRDTAQKLYDQGVDYDATSFMPTIDYSGISTSSGGSSGSSDSEENQTEVIDWIETKISRIQEKIDSFSDKAESTFRAISGRLKSTNDEIKSTFDEISIQQKAYDRYIKEANSVGLSSDLVDKVKNGTIDITEYDSDIADKISDYQNWYDKAVECKNAIDDLNESIAELYQNKFDNVQTDFENQLSLLEHTANEYNNKLDMLEERGRFAQSKYYRLLLDNEQKEINSKKDELEQLTDLFNEALKSGKIEKYSESWYDMKNAIDEVSESIQEAEKSVVELNNSIRDLKWEKFDYALERVDQLINETDFLTALLDDEKLYEDNGQLTDYGLAKMGLAEQNYAVYMSKAARYADEYKEIEEELEKDPYNKTLIERKEELLQLQQEAIKSAQDEKNAIIDMVEEGIDKELESVQKLIDAYTDALDSAKSLNDYQKTVSEKTSEIASIKKQLIAYSGDTSEETRATIQKLNEDLKNAEDDLQETEYDRYISDQKELLENLYSEYETILNQRLDNVDSLMADITSKIGESTDIISNAIADVANSVGYDPTDQINNIWDNKDWKGWKESVSNVLNEIYRSVGGTESLLMGDVNGDGKITAEDARLAARAAARLETLTDEELARADLDRDGKVSLSEARAILRTSARLQSLDAEPSGSDDYTIIDNIFERLFGNSSAQPLIDTSALSPNIESFSPLNSPVARNSESIRDVTYQITIPIDHVLDYEDFMNRMKSDTKFANFLQSATISKLSGGNSLNKNKYTW